MERPSGARWFTYPVAALVLAIGIWLALIVAVRPWADAPLFARASLAPAVPQPSTAAPSVSDPCGTAQELISAGELSQAESAYETAAKNGAPCPAPVIPGLTAELPPAPSIAPADSPSGASLIDQARAQAAAIALLGHAAEVDGNRPLAIALYRRALSIDVAQPDAVARLAALTPATEPDESVSPSASPYAEALALAAAGFDAAAKESALAELKKRATDNEDPAYPPALDYLRDQTEPLRTVNQWLRVEWLLWIPIGVCVLAGVVGLLAYRNARRDNQCHLQLGDIGATDAKVASAIQAMVTSEIDLLQRDITGSGLAIQLAPDQKIDIPVEVFDELPKGKLISALWTWTEPAAWSLTGDMLWDDDRGDGIAITLLDPYKRQFNATFWDDEFRPATTVAPAKPADSFAAPHARLARAIASWLAYRQAKGDVRRKLRTAAAATWQSYAHFRIGVEAQTAQDFDTASSLYAIALGEDPMNPGAAFDMAAITLGNGPSAPGDTTYLDDAEALLARVATRVDPEASPRDTLWNRYIYNSTVIPYERALSLDETDPPSTPEARRERWNPVVATARAACEALLGVSRSHEGADLHQFRNLVEDVTFLLYGGALARRDLPEPLGSTTSIGPQPDTRAPGVSEPVARRVYRDAMVTAVGSTTCSAGQVKATVDLYGPWRLSPRAQYNYVCLLSDLHLDQVALAVLRPLLLDAYLARRAEADPALERLRSTPAWQELRPAETAGLLAIGTAWAGQLSAHGISTIAQLAAATDTPDGVARLSLLLPAPEVVVARWAGLAALVTCVTVDVAEANLLDAAGIGSPEALASSDPDAATSLLGAVNATLHLLDTAPDLATVTNWIALAQLCDSGTAIEAVILPPLPGG